MNIHMCDIHKISRSRKYQYRCYAENKTLTETLNRTKLCDPVYLLKDQNADYILDGFRRIYALRSSSVCSESVPAIILTPDTLTYDIHIGLILKQHAQSPLPFIEKVSAFHLLRTLYSETGTSRILRDLSLPHAPDYHTIYDAFPELDRRWFAFFTDHDVPGRRIKHFFQSVTLNSVTELLAFNPGLNRLEQLLTMLSEISRRDSLTHREILDHILPETSTPKSFDSLFNAIYHLRYPLISQYEKKIDAFLTAMDMPSNVTVHCDTRGEKPGISVHITINDEHDLTTSHKWFENNRDTLSRLIKERLEL